MRQQPSSELLRVENLTKIFQIRHGFSTREFRAVDDAAFTLTAAKPEIFTIAGESGSGKTTLARMVLGMEQPSSGILQYKGRNIADLSLGEKRAWFFKEVQPVFQDPFAAFSPLKKIDHYLYETVHNYKMAKKSETDDYVNEVLQQVGLTLAEVRGAIQTNCQADKPSAWPWRAAHQPVSHRR